MHRTLVLLPILGVGCTPTPEATSPPPCDEADDGSATTAVVEVPLSTGGSFAIDATEVTTYQYAQFLADVGDDTSGQPAACAWNSSYEPDADCLAEDRERWAACGKLPQVCVDWCDARAYCAWAGKRLCGAPSGGPEPSEATHVTSQWITACSAGGRNDYVYAAEYDEEAALVCNVAECTARSIEGCGFVVEVDAHPECQSAVEEYAGVYDLAGNVAEWVDGCEAEAGRSDACTRRGSSTLDGGAFSRCVEQARVPRDTVHRMLGFRCCGT